MIQYTVTLTFCSACWCAILIKLRNVLQCCNSWTVCNTILSMQLHSGGTLANKSIQYFTFWSYIAEKRGLNKYLNFTQKTLLGAKCANERWLLTTKHTELTLIWDVTSCHLVERYKYFEGTCCLLLHGKRQETLVPTCQVIRCHMSQVLHGI